jgi:lipopolysaccharide transport system permease protein
MNMASNEVRIISEAPEFSYLENFNPLKLLRKVFRQKELLRQFIWWEVNDRYRGSALGILWTILVPLLRLSVYTLVFSILLGGRKAVWGLESNLDVGAMIFCGFLMFNVFAESVGKSPRLMWINRSYVKNIVFPLEILPVTAVGVSIVHTVIGMGVLVTLELLINREIYWTVIYLPLVVAPLVFFSTGLSWLLATVGVFNRDIDNLMQSLIQMLFLLSGIVFPLDRLVKLFPEQWQWLVRLNILSSVVEDTRRVVLQGLSPDWLWFNLDLAASFLCLLIGYSCFMHFKRQFADVL